MVTAQACRTLPYYQSISRLHWTTCWSIYTPPSSLKRNKLLATVQNYFLRAFTHVVNTSINSKTRTTTSTKDRQVSLQNVVFAFPCTPPALDTLIPTSSHFVLTSRQVKNNERVATQSIQSPFGALEVLSLVGEGEGNCSNALDFCLLPFWL